MEKESGEPTGDGMDFTSRPNIELSSDELDMKISKYLSEAKEYLYTKHPELEAESLLCEDEPTCRVKPTRKDGESNTETKAPSRYEHIDCSEFVPLGPHLSGTLGGMSEALRVCREGTPKEKARQRRLAEIEMGRPICDGKAMGDVIIRRIEPGHGDMVTNRFAQRGSISAIVDSKIAMKEVVCGAEDDKSSEKTIPDRNRMRNLKFEKPVTKIIWVDSSCKPPPDMSSYTIPRPIYGDEDPIPRQVFPADRKPYMLTNTLPSADCSDPPRLPDGTSLSDHMSSAQLHRHHFPDGMELETESTYMRITDIYKPKKRYSLSPVKSGKLSTSDEIKRKTPANVCHDSHDDSEKVGCVNPLTYRDLATAPTAEQTKAVLDYAKYIENVINDGSVETAESPNQDGVIPRFQKVSSSRPTRNEMQCFLEATKRYYNTRIPDHDGEISPDQIATFTRPAGNDLIHCLSPIPQEGMPETPHEHGKSAEKERLNEASNLKPSLCDLIEPGTKAVNKEVLKETAASMFGFGFGEDASGLTNVLAQERYKQQEEEYEEFQPDPEIKGPREVNLKPGSSMRQCQYCHAREGQELIDEMIQCKCKEYLYCDQECRDGDLPYHKECFVLCGCGKKSTKRCGRCKTKRYCSKKCQREDWPFHRRNCIPPK